MDDFAKLQSKILEEIEHNKAIFDGASITKSSRDRSEQYSYLDIVRDRLDTLQALLNQSLQIRSSNIEVVELEVNFEE